ncbi:restriction endonuclease [Leptospira ilyithenensis]|uniref:Restriction endonuclease n=1 Tax=Leptospira ilyithenensis TaxID=2484901 RepID=A0A4R9LKP8_9LEPT|nr:restriction endonuclease [Leptospira ilyithenensis]TGN06795.1 restriction endonuclease [Leptospira ilyithenensis]
MLISILVNFLVYNVENITMSNNILQDWGISVEEFSKLVIENPSLRGMILGYVAEFQFEKNWLSNPKISDISKTDDHDRKQKGDRNIRYKNKRFIIEVKSLQTNTVKRVDDSWVGKTQIDASDNREVKLPSGEIVKTTCLVVGEFDLVAINLFAFSGEWVFAFAKNSDLPRTKSNKYTDDQKKHLLATTATVSYPPQPPFFLDPFPLLDELLEER